MKNLSKNFIKISSYILFFSFIPLIYISFSNYEVGCDKIFNTSIEPLNGKEIFVMGHVYETNPDVEDGISKNLINFLERQKIDNNTIGIFAGDLIRSPNEKSLTNAKTQIEKHFKYYYNSQGNHDMHESYEEIIGKKYFEFETNNFLIIGTDFNTNNWLPSNTDKEKINKSILNTEKKTIILVSHPIFWINAASDDVVPNNIPDKVNPVIDPFKWIKLNNKNLIVISGDSGKWGQELLCEEINKNITVISNGLGGFKNDTIIKIIESEEDFSFEKVKIND